MKTHAGVEGSLQAFLTSALDGGEWLASHPGRFSPDRRLGGPQSWSGPRVNFILLPFGRLYALFIYMKI
jgi:hypothetical protein